MVGDSLFVAVLASQARVPSEVGGEPDFLVAPSGFGTDDEAAIDEFVIELPVELGLRLRRLHSESGVAGGDVQAWDDAISAAEFELSGLATDLVPPVALVSPGLEVLDLQHVQRAAEIPADERGDLLGGSHTSGEHVDRRLVALVAVLARRRVVEDALNCLISLLDVDVDLLLRTRDGRESEDDEENHDDENHERERASAIHLNSS